EGRGVCTVRSNNLQRLWETQREFIYSRSFSPETNTKRLLSNGLRERWKGNTFGSRNRGRRHTDTERKKISASRVGKPSPFNLLWHNPEFRAKMKVVLSERNRRLWRDKDYRERQTRVLLRSLLKRPTS